MICEYILPMTTHHSTALRCVCGVVGRIDDRVPQISDRLCIPLSNDVHLIVGNGRVSSSPPIPACTHTAGQGPLMP